MPINNRELIAALAVLSDNENLRACAKKSGQGAVVCGAICMLGGLLMGPIGLAVGGTVGGLTAFLTSGEFRSVGEILKNDLSSQQQAKLVRHLNSALTNFGIEDVLLLISMISTNASAKEAVLKIITSFVTNELKMQIF